LSGPESNRLDGFFARGKLPRDHPSTPPLKSLRSPAKVALGQRIERRFAPLDHPIIHGLEPC